MRRALSVLLAIMMVTAISPFISVNAATKTTGNNDQGAITSDQGKTFKAAALFGRDKISDENEPASKEVIVQLKDSDDADLSKSESETVEQIEALSAGSKRSKIEIADGITVKGDEVWEFSDGSKDGTLTVALATSGSLSTKKMVKKLQSVNIVEAVSPNYRRHKTAVDDPYTKFQWGMDGYPGIDTFTEWGSGNTGSAENIVAVVDTGIYYKHEDLQGQMWRNPYGSKLKGTHGFDFVNRDTDPEDDDGHGTHCAGIIGAATNGIGGQGVNQNVSLMGLKVLDDVGEGYDSDIIAALNYISKAMDLGTNVVAVNCSFGGGDYDEVFENVIDKVGKKGAVFVCAAGNDESNNDEAPVYPADYDCSCIISVAATKNSNGKPELVSFSNYGKESVDVAAPGTDILSTVCFDTFNPTLYRDNTDLVPTLLDGSEESVQWILSDGLTNLDAADISSEGSEGFMSDDGAICIHFDPAKTSSTQKWQYVAIPYDLPDDYDEENDDVGTSIMARTIGPDSLTTEQYFDDTYDKLILMDVPRSLLDGTTKESQKFFSTGCEELIYDYASYFTMVLYNEDYWTHYNMSLSDSAWAETEGDSDESDSSVSKERALLIIGDSQAEAFTAYIDDIGISKCVSDTKVFGKYDFYSGTSMATPYVAGAAALIAAADKDKEGYGSEMVIEELLSTANDTNPISKVSTEGTIDFANKETGFWIGISGVTVDAAQNLLTLKGGFNTGESGSLEISFKKEGQKEPQIVPAGDIVSKSNKEIVIKDGGWINNIASVTVKGTKNGKTKKATKSDLYLVKGKNKYETLDDSTGIISNDAAMATDGRMIYLAESTGDDIYSLDAKNTKSLIDDGASDIAVFDKKTVQKSFESAAKKNLSDTAQYDFRFGDDLVSIGKDLFVMGSFCEVGPESEFDEDEWKKSDIKSDFEEGEDDERFPDSHGVSYSDETALFRVNASTGKITKLKLPESADLLTDCRMASYNGNLYLMGGINESENTLSSKVFKYNASSGKWTEAAAMPAGRAGGKVLQTGSRLVYALGYGEESMVNDDGTETIPANYIFDGKSWKKGAESLQPIYADAVARGGAYYVQVNGSVGICKEGLVYMAAPVEDYGDTFIYDAAADKFTSLNWNYAMSIDDIWSLSDGEMLFNGLAVGDQIIGYDENYEIRAVRGAIHSGLCKVTAGKAKGGKITGTGSYLSGAVCQVNAVAKPGFYAKSLTIAGAPKAKAVAKGLSISTVATKDVKAAAKFAKYKFSSPDSITVKAGGSKALKAKITPAAAAKQWKLAYKSSNKKYATVSAKGVVKAKKAGKGNTVTVKILLKGTSKVLKKVKVKIK